MTEKEIMSSFGQAQTSKFAKSYFYPPSIENKAFHYLARSFQRQFIKFLYSKLRLMRNIRLIILMALNKYASGYMRF